MLQNTFNELFFLLFFCFLSQYDILSIKPVFIIIVHLLLETFLVQYQKYCFYLTTCGIMKNMIKCNKSDVIFITLLHHYVFILISLSFYITKRSLTPIFQVSFYVFLCTLKIFVTYSNHFCYCMKTNYNCKDWNIISHATYKRYQVS